MLYGVYQDKIDHDSQLTVLRRISPRAVAVKHQEDDQCGQQGQEKCKHDAEHQYYHAAHIPILSTPRQLQAPAALPKQHIPFRKGAGHRRQDILYWFRSSGYYL